MAATDLGNQGLQNTGTGHKGPKSHAERNAYYKLPEFFQFLLNFLENVCYLTYTNSDCYGAPVFQFLVINHVEGKALFLDLYGFRTRDFAVHTKVKNLEESKNRSIYPGHRLC